MLAFIALTGRTQKEHRAAVLTSITTTKEHNHKDYGTEACLPVYSILMMLSFSADDCRTRRIPGRCLFVLTNDGYWRIIKNFPATASARLITNFQRYFISLWTKFLKVWNVVNSRGRSRVWVQWEVQLIEVKPSLTCSWVEKLENIHDLAL